MNDEVINENLAGKDGCRQGQTANESLVFSEKRDRSTQSRVSVCEELLSVHGVTGWKIKSTHTEILKKEMSGKNLQL